MTLDPTPNPSDLTPNPSTPTATTWHIVQQPEGHCEIIAGDNIAPPLPPNHWGPYPTQGEAIAKRVGLIRSGKCRPI
jgi:hypothetical protein